MMFCCSSSRLRRSSSRSVSVWTSERSRTMDSLKVTAIWPISSRDVTGTSWERSPRPTRSATLTRALTGRVMPLGEDHAREHRDRRDPAQHQEQEVAGPDRRGADDRLVHAHPHGPEAAAQHGHADVDDLALAPAAGIEIGELLDLRPGGLPRHHVLLDDALRHHRREGVGDECALGIVDHDVGHAGDLGELVDLGLHGGRVAIDHEVRRGARQAVGDGAALVGELAGQVLLQRPVGDDPARDRHRQQDQHEEDGDLAEQAEPRPGGRSGSGLDEDPGPSARFPHRVPSPAPLQAVHAHVHALTAAAQSATGTQRSPSTRVK